MPERPSLTAPAPDRAPRRIAQSSSPDAFQVTALFMMIVAILYFGKEVLEPVTLALLLAFILAPLVGLLRRLHIGRVPSVLLGVILALGVVLSIGAVIGGQIAELATNLPQYSATVETKVEAAKAYTVGRLSKLADSVGQKHNAAAPSGQSTSQKTSVATVQTTGPEHSSSPLELAQTYLSPVLSPLATFGIVFVVAVFALLQREDLRDRLIRLLGSDDLHRTTLAIDDGAERLSKFFLTQLMINTLFGVVIGIGLVLIGVPNPVLWGILSALLRFVPYVGSFISAVLPLAMAAAVEPGWTMVLWTLGLYVVSEALTGQVIEPLVYGHSTGLSPFSVVVAAIFWSWLWGPVGLILSTPLTLCLVVMGRHVKRLEFLDVMLGDRPALTPVESFYQRILAQDHDEAQEQAEIILKDHTLTDYYDEVALKGLQRAAGDIKLGVLTDEQVEEIKTTVQELIEGLSKHEDIQPPPKKSDANAVDDGDDDGIPRNPPPATLGDDVGGSELWRQSSAILCIGGRGPLDEAASSMLAQLLNKHGIGGRLVGYDAVARDTIDMLETENVVMACISYLDITGSPAHLRYLIQRLRKRLPKGAKIMVGLWPSGDRVTTDRDLQQNIGADFFVSSLHQAVTACVEHAITPSKQ